MAGLPEWMLTPFGQGRKQQGRQDYDNNYRDQYRGGEIERDGVESFFDNVLRGGSDQVQQAAQDRHIQRLEATGAGTYLMDERGRDIKATDTDKGLRKAAKQGKAEDEAIGQLRQAGYTGDTSQLQGQGAGAIYGMVPDQLRKTKRDNYNADPATQQLLYDRKVDRLDRLERERNNLAMRRDEMEYRYAAMARQDRLDAQNRRDKAIMALMQGLGNLGAAFTI